MTHPRHPAFAFKVVLLLLAFGASSTPLRAGDFDSVKSWVYQLTKYKDDKLDEIADAGFDLAVIDLTRDGKDDYFTRGEIDAVRRRGVIVLAYFEIGAIENYRPEWNDVPDDVKLAKVKGWPKERLVKYWDDRWWAVVKGRVDRALAAGFNGAYLDLVTAYEESPAKDIPREELARRMVDLISRISKYAKSIDPEFKIVPQNAPELYTWSNWEGPNGDPAPPNQTYLDAIDGIGMEDVFYLPHDKPAKAKWAKENRDNALAIRQAGKIVLAVDYCKKPKSIVDAYAKERAIGFVPYVTTVNLDAVRKEPAGVGQK